MVDEVMMQLALRVKAMTLTVATTGLVSLSATPTGYARASGSFKDDGLYPGMEITPAGFANNAPAVITDVTPLAITAGRIVATVVNGVTVYSLGAVTPEADGAGRSLTVGLPSQFVFENRVFEPTAGIPWVREEFLPGPTGLVTLGPNAELEAEPQYALYVNCPASTGLTAKRYVNALRVLFAPATLIPLANGDFLHVRGDTGPFAGQLQQGTAGFAVQPFTVPLRLRSRNSV